MVDGDVGRLSYSMSGKKMESLAGFSTMALYALLGMHQLTGMCNEWHYCLDSEHGVLT